MGEHLLLTKLIRGSGRAYGIISSVHCPLKIKNILWRAISNTIAVRSNLVRGRSVRQASARFVPNRRQWNIS